MATKDYSLLSREDLHTYLVLEIGKNQIQITLTDDNSNNAKSAFNLLLKELKRGLFEFELEDGSSDLYNNICVEYLNQLNAEIKTIHAELEEYELTEKE